MKWLVIIFLSLLSSNAYGTTPRYNSNQMQSSSRSTSTINETIITENYNTGYIYSVSGHNIKISEGSYISPDATYTTSQNTGNGNVTFEWISPDLTTLPKWEIVDQGSDFSLIEHVENSGLDAISIIQREQVIETFTEQVTLFN